MVILALDTTTRSGSCAVAVDGRIVREEGSDPSRDHAVQLPGTLASLLERATLPLDRVDAFAVATGPGSFTGLRIGIASMQGLSVATGKPLIGVSALDALAAVASSPGEPDKARPTIVATWMDAWRGEVYAALYENGREAASPAVLHPETVLARLDDSPTLFIGDGV